MQKNQKILMGVAIVLLALAALIFKSGVFNEQVKAEVTLLNNSVLILEENIKDQNEVLRITVTAKNADIFPKKFYLNIAGERNFNCKLWTAYQRDLIAEGSGEEQLELKFKEGMKLEKDSPSTWSVFCDLQEMGEGESIQVNLKADPAVLEWESASRQNFREIKLLTDNLAGKEISR